MRETTYSSLQKWLHAVSMIIIVWLMMSGYYAALISQSPSLKEAIGAFNVSLGAVFTPVFFYRMYVSFGKGFFQVLRSKDAMQYMVFIAHSMIYLSTAVVLISGVLMMGRDISIFGIFSIPFLVTDVQFLSLFSVIHNVACMCLGLLLLLHVAAVIKHQLCGHAVLKRMFA